MKPLPNILFIFPDQMRGDWTQMNSNIPMHTPNLKKLADNGVHFSQTYCPSPICSPSRSCLAVGKEYDKVNIIDNGQNHPFDDPTFYELLRDKAGYYTMTCGKLDLRHPEHSYGNDGKHIVNGVDYLAKWGFSFGIEIGGKLNGAKMWQKNQDKIDPYICYLRDKGLAEAYVNDFKAREFQDAFASPLEDEDYIDNWIGRSGLEMLKNAPKDRPWFIQVNFAGPHNPLNATKKMLDRWTDVISFPPPYKSTRFSEKENLQIRQNYSAMIENIDSWIPRFLQEIERRGELENTLIIFASDHGDMLGDHNRVAKSVPFQGAISVPLIIAGPTIKHTPPITKPVGLIDLFATVLDFAGIPCPAGVDSVSLKPILQGNSEASTRFIRSGLHHFRVVIEGDYKLIVGFEKSHKIKKKLLKVLKKMLFGNRLAKEIHFDSVKLFDLSKDPYELQDISAENPEIVEHLLKNLI